jgi:hypothetical protein
MKFHGYTTETMRCSIYALVLVLSSVAGAQQRTLAPPEFTAWPPISDAERAMKSPSVEKDAGAEVLLWRVHVVDELLGDNRDLQRVLYHYIRLKVFDEKGKEKASTIDLDYREPGAILDVAGRTIRPDGTVVELDRKSIYKRDVIRAGRRPVKTVAFAMPAVEPGAILEYRWRQIEDDNRFRYVRLQFQREFPVEKVAYFVKPLSSRYVAAEQMAVMRFNCEPSPIKQENDGYNSLVVENVRAAHHEPLAPSDPNIEPWALLFYRQGSVKQPDQYWNEEGKKTYHEIKDSVKGGEELKAAVQEAVAGARNEEEKVTALVGYIRKSLRNLNDPQITQAEREKFLEKLPNDRFRTSAEIFKSGIATSREMNVAFAAAAMAAGLEARPVLASDRAEYAFNPKLADVYFVDNLDMAVKLGDSWKVVDVSNRLLTPGMLPWRQEGMSALLADPKAPMFLRLPVSAPDASVERRTAQLQLAVDGTLAGEVEETYTGHRAEDYREEIANQSPAQREEWFRKRIVRMFPDADVTGIKLDNAEDASKPLVARYHLDAPHFAQVTGKRILFQPNAFRRAEGSPFTATERRFSIEFPYSWHEIDSIHIRLPEGFALDNADSPGGLNFGDTGSYQLQMTVGNGELVTSRDFTFGNRGIIFFEAKNYLILKKIFDQIEVRDTHTISLKAN